MKGESWNTISIIGCLKNSLTLVLSILISIHHSAERFQRTFKTGNFDFKFQISIKKNWKRNHDRRNGREYFQFNVSSISPLVDASSNRTHFHSCLSFNRAFHDRATRKRGERRFEWSTLVSRVLYGGASDYASQRLPRTTFQSRFPWRNSLLPWIVFVL